FDVGALIGNLLLAYFAQEGHATAADDREGYRVWILDQIDAIWQGFEARFLALWRNHPAGDGYTAELFADREGAQALETERQRYMARLFDDTVGFGGCKMIRRILGLAHVADLETIADPDRRARCERNALRLGRAMVAEHGNFRTTADLRIAAEAIRKEGSR
ncbi:MAG TPA: S-methyl-5-thioribose kinase, partial [Alphaproteobacteria bacterium]|nr:S-methyl-5-thioribose kinase [Alphaproteobacteria bacterium]